MQTLPNRLLKIQEFLKSFPDIVSANKQLVTQFHIDIGEGFLGGVEPVWVYNYNMITSRGSNPIENEARALILDKNAEVVSISFPRFFNAHEPHAASIDWNTAIAERKHDGSLVVVYNHKGNYFIQTRRNAVAGGSVYGGTVSNYYEMVFEVLSSKFSDPFGPFKRFDPRGDYCWVFEIVSPLNRIVTLYEETDVVLLAAVNKRQLREMNSDHVSKFASDNGFTRPTMCKVNSVEEVVQICEGLDELHEGFVVRDSLGNRIKIKNRAYTRIGRAVNAGGETSPKHFAEITLRGDAEEFKSYFGGYKEIIGLMQNVLQDIFREVNEIWLANRDIPSRKEFAEVVLKYRLSDILFKLRSGKIKNVDEASKFIKAKFLVEETKLRHRAVFNKLWQKVLFTRGDKAHGSTSRRK